METSHKNFDVNGRCGVECHVFQKGNCENSQEFKPDDLLEVYDAETAQEIIEYYPLLLAKQSERK